MMSTGRLPMKIVRAGDGGGREERRVEGNDCSSEEASAIPAGVPEGYGECSAEGRVEMRVP